MSDMSWIRGFCRRSGSRGGVRLRWTSLGARRLSRSRSWSKADRGVDAASLKPYFTGTDPASIQRGVDDLKATGIYSAVSAKVVDGQDRRFAQRRQADHQSRRLRGQQQDHQGSARGRGAVEAGHGLSTRPTAEGDIDRIKEAYKKYGRNEARVTKRLVAAAERPRRPRVHHRRRRQDRHSRDPVRRQPRGLGLPSAQPDADEHDELSVVGSRTPTSTIRTASPPTRRRSAAIT